MSQHRCRYPMLALLAAAGLWPAINVSADVEVVTTIQPIHSLIAGVTKGVNEPYQLVRGRQSPHGYELSTTDARNLYGADVVFASGENIESFLLRAQRNMDEDTRVVWLEEVDGMTLYEARRGGSWAGHEHDHGDGEPGEHDANRQEEEHDHHGESDHDDHDDHGDHEDNADGDGDIDERRLDGHIWLDPRNAQVITEHAADLLAELDPGNAEHYRANAEDQVERLAALEEEITERLAPVRDRPYLVFHDAYQAFERRFGLNAVGSISVEPDRPPGARRIDDLRSRIADEGIVCVFAEPQFEPKVVRTVREGTDTRTGELDPLGTEFEPGPDAYFQLMRDLTASLQECLTE